LEVCRSVLDLISDIRSLQHTTGRSPTRSSRTCSCAGLKTFALPMEPQNYNAHAAEFLAAHSRVNAVHYAGLPSHEPRWPQHGEEADALRRRGLVRGARRR